MSMRGGTSASSVAGDSATADTFAQGELSTPVPMENPNSNCPLDSVQVHGGQDEQRQNAPVSSTNIEQDTSSPDNLYWLSMLVESLTSRIRQIVNQNNSTGSEGTESSTTTETATNRDETASTTDVWSQVRSIWEAVMTQFHQCPIPPSASLNPAMPDTETTATVATTPPTVDSGQGSKHFENLGSTISDIAQSLISTCHSTPCITERDVYVSSCSNIMGKSFRPE
jgi:hypothetical protein